MAGRSIRGAGTDRSGPLETTQLIWKVIDANPGITRDGVVAKVLPSVPSGWASRRRMPEDSPGHRYKTLGPQRLVSLDARKRYLIVSTLAKMVSCRSIAKSADGGYTTLRPLRNYKGDVDRVDETGTVAADHLNDAYALRVAETWMARESRACKASEVEALYRVIRFARRLSREPQA